MILIVLKFPLQFQSQVCYLVCAVHEELLDYWFVCIVHVSCALRLWIFWIVRCMLCYRYYILILIFRYDLMYMKTKELGWKDTQGIQNIGMKDSQGNRIVD